MIYNCLIFLFFYFKGHLNREMIFEQQFLNNYLSYILIVYSLSFLFSLSIVIVQ